MRWFKRLWKKYFKRKVVKPKRPNGTVVSFIDGHLVDIEIHNLKDFTYEQKQFFVESMKLLVDILNSREFYHGFMALNVTETNGMSLGQIYRQLLNGQEALDRQIDNALDLTWSLYGNDFQKSQTIGYTYPNVNMVWTHRWFFKRWMKHKLGRAYLCGHVTHEYAHKLGYSHRLIKSKSLVYQLGYLVRDIGIEVIKGKKLTRMEL